MRTERVILRRKILEERKSSRAFLRAAARRVEMQARVIAKQNEELDQFRKERDERVIILPTDQELAKLGPMK